MSRVRCRAEAGYCVCGEDGFHKSHRCRDCGSWPPTFVAASIPDVDPWVTAAVVGEETR